ncbi:MAG: hypothetical protein AB7V04_03905 [Desulfomonilaceae bacterium]
MSFKIPDCNSVAAITIIIQRLPFTLRLILGDNIWTFHISVLLVCITVMSYYLIGFVNGSFHDLVNVTSTVCD